MSRTTMTGEAKVTRCDYLSEGGGVACCCSVD